MAQSGSKDHSRLWVLIPIFVILLTLLLWAADREMRAGFGAKGELSDEERLELLRQLSSSSRDVSGLSDEERLELLEASSRMNSSAGSAKPLTDEERIKLLESL